MQNERTRTRIAKASILIFYNHKMGIAAAAVIFMLLGMVTERVIALHGEGFVMVDDTQHLLLSDNFVNPILSAVTVHQGNGDIGYYIFRKSGDEYIKVVNSHYGHKPIYVTHLITPCQWSNVFAHKSCDENIGHGYRVRFYAVTWGKALLNAPFDLFDGWVN